MYIAGWSELHCLSQNAIDKDSMIKRHMYIYADLSQCVSTVCPSGKNAQAVETDQHMHL